MTEITAFRFAGVGLRSGPAAAAPAAIWGNAGPPGGGRLESDFATKNSAFHSRPRGFHREQRPLGVVVLWRCLSPPDKLAAFYLTTIGVFSVDAIGAIENTSQVFQPDDRF